MGENICKRCDQQGLNFQNIQIAHITQEQKKDKKWAGTFLVVQWLRIHLPMQGMQVRSLVGELRSHVPRGNKADAPQLLSLCAATTEPTCSGACMPQLERSPHATTREEPVHRNKEPMHCNKRSCTLQLRPDAAKNKSIFFFKKDI